MTEPAKQERNSEPARLVAFAIFLIGVVIPALVAVVRMFFIGVGNASLFGVPPSTTVDPGADVTLWVTATVITVATGAIACLAAVELWHRQVLIAGLVLTALGVLAAALNWWILVG